ncbi:MAG: UDP-N-acetylmuramate:L-alanyl-gamma-D-glutamyl-meso-diaminopimelate ligase [Burkholderiaceae bacterium]|nr:UDP-N-acetylmuramate:L-alanyl-gamma-D-glutamyl-meso-diaminopimelate ligase [Sulfuritalea sp.]MCF8175763.1 UDP-N-acetylmuramate:L-alanyl-gamma-D-glutamyl-meso-diaminopimelate ligase [Burkholderiaceae bacterium]
MHIHILGICGTFMGGIALLARSAGHRVTGCDADVYPPMSTQLGEQGIDLVAGYGAEQLALNPDLFVVGNAISRGNPLLEAILDRNLPYVSGPQWLAENILRGRWVLGVAGTHGKTTTTSMLAWILEEAGLNPSFLVGGVPQGFGVSARLTDSPFFVIEADEYDTAFCDKRSKFVHYQPRTTILNNLEFDHADIFVDLASIETQFHHLVRTLPGNGLIVSNAVEASLERVLAKGCWTPVEWFNRSEGWQVGAPDEAGGFSVSLAGKVLGRVRRFDLAGDHNRANAVAALAAARHAGVPVAVGLKALEGFAGIRRRLEVRGVERGVTVIDDFAHHPTAIRATLAGLRQKVGPARILAVLEPRSNTMKLGTMNEQLPGSLADADLVFCYANKLGWNATQALAPLGLRSRVFDELDVLIAAVAADAHAGDQVLIMSNGSFGGIHERLLALLAAEHQGVVDAVPSR